MTIPKSKIGCFCQWFILLLFLVSATQVQAKKLQCFVLKPPKKILTDVHRIAIVDFAVTSSFHQDNPPSADEKDLEKILAAILKLKESSKKNQLFADGGQKMAEAMISKLLNEKRGIQKIHKGFLGLSSKEGKTFQEGARTNVFAVVERDQVDQVMQELELGQSGLVDEKNAAQVGRMLGVDAIITGSVNISYRSKWFEEKRTVDKDSSYNVNCNRHRAVVSANLRIIRVESGQIVGSTHSRSKKEYKWCEDHPNKQLPLPETIVDEALNTVSEDLVNYFAPHFELKKIDLARIKAKQFKRMAELAEKAADNDEIDDAYAYYHAIMAKDPYNHAAVYNVGALNEIVGNYDEALRLYTIAAGLKSREKKYRKAIERTRKQIKFWEDLAALGLEPVFHDFTLAAGGGRSMTVIKVQVKGSDSDRYPIKAAPASDSETLVIIPGDIELEFLGRTGGWYKVKLIDGREGYISRKDAKIMK